MFYQVICTCERQYYKINYKYERYECTKTKACCRNISSSSICSLIFFIFFFLYGDLKFWLNVFHHSHNKRKDSLKTRAILIEISMSCWNLPSSTGQGRIQAQFDSGWSLWAPKKIRPKMFFVAKINTLFSC